MKLSTSLTATMMVLIVGMGSLIVAQDAVAWDERAQKSITTMAMQIVKQQFPDAFEPGRSNYDLDVIQGCVDGYAALAGEITLNNDADTIQAIGTEIQTIRDIRPYGSGSYFAYRMGMLSALVSDVMIPYGFVWDERSKFIQEDVFKDIDAHLDSYSYVDSTDNHLEFVRAPKPYFAARRTFYKDDFRLITNDYQRGVGYNGFLKKSGPVYFIRAVNAVADVWFTVLRREGDRALTPASSNTLTWYFVHEIEYLLNEKDNILQAGKAYGNFVKVNPNLPEAYEQVGDLYANHGSEEGIERSVREWRIAHDIGGPERRRIAKKLSSYYMTEGRIHLEAAAEPGALDTDLPNALRAFESALDFDRTSAEAASRIHETHVAINERNERFEMTVDIISNGERTAEMADGYAEREDYTNAIETYRMAISLLEAVDDEFKDQSKAAQSKMRDLKKSISTVINDLLDRANEAIDNGTRNVEDLRYDEAIANFQKVPNILAAIDEGASQTHQDEKADVLELAINKANDAKAAKASQAQAMEAQQNAEAQGAAKPAAPGAGGFKLPSN